MEPGTTEVKIRTRDGHMEVAGEIVDDSVFAVTAHGRSEWNVTHVPSGLGVGIVRYTKERAKAAVRAILAELPKGLDMNDPNPSADPRPAWCDALIAAKERAKVEFADPEGPPLDPKRKLYAVEVRFSYYAYAEDEREAKAQLSEACDNGDDDSPDLWVTEVRDDANIKHADGWQPDDYVYGDHGGNYRLRDVWPGVKP